jgi:hypothetical protein
MKTSIFAIALCAAAFCLSCSASPSSVRVDDPGGTLTVDITDEAFVITGQGTGTFVVVDEADAAIVTLPLVLDISLDSEAGIWTICPSLEAGLRVEKCWQGDLNVDFGGADEAEEPSSEEEAPAAEGSGEEAPAEGSGSDVPL